MVQESGGAGPRHLHLLAAFQHRLAVKVNTENSLDTDRRPEHPEVVPHCSRLWCDAVQKAPVLRVTDPSGRVGEKLKTHHEVRSFVKRTNMVLIEFPSPSFLYMCCGFWRCASPPPLPGLSIQPVVWWICYGSKSDTLEKGLSFSIITRTEHTLTNSDTHIHSHAPRLTLPESEK